jgi:transcription antitermination protein NusB
MTDDKQTRKKTPHVGLGERRSAARLAAVQALYQMDLVGASLPDVLAEFQSHWMGREIEGDQYKPAESALFRTIIQGVLDHQRSLDPKIDQTLSDGWPLRRVEAVMRAALRAGAYELFHTPDVPPKVIISEYVDIARAFFEKDETSMVNAVMDRLARQARPDAFG